MALTLSAGRVGVDIGTSAVRVAQVGRSRGGYVLQRFAQAPVPFGAVNDGEVADPDGVAEALSQAFARARLRTRRAHLAIANQRVVVRVVDVPWLDDKALRSSLRYQVAEHVPMPLDDAELDHRVLEDYVTEDGERMLRLLLMAGARDMITAFVEAAAKAKVETLGVDLVPLAVARAVSPVARGERGLGGAEAVVDVGAGVTSILIHLNGETRFVRILLVGGDDATAAIAAGLDVDHDEAEALKLDLAAGSGSPEVERIVEERVGVLVDEIRGSFDYYATQEDATEIASVVLTGGGSLTPGLLPRLQATLPAEITRGAPLSAMNTRPARLTAEQVELLEPVAATAVGTAMGALG